MAFLSSLRPSFAGQYGRHQRALSVSSSMPPISEASSSRDPPIPQRTSYRFSNGRVPGSPGFEFENYGPPQFGTYSEAYSSASEKNGERSGVSPRGLGNNKRFAQRGSWLRLALIGLITALAVLGIGLGVGLGLRNRHKSSNTAKNEAIGSANSTSSSNNPLSSGPASVEGAAPSNTAFPAGSYTFNTYLSTPLTDCTSNPSTWLCSPNSTYAQSASSSGAAFDWIISKAPNTPNNYSISSIKNPFALNFTNLSLSLMSAGTAEEHYFLQTSMEKTTNPIQLGSDNVAATCHFDDTTFQAYLYTKKLKTYPKSEDNGSTSNGAWPYAVKIEQVSAAGAGMPSCLDRSGKSLGDFSREDNGQLCDCLYLNTGT